MARLLLSLAIIGFARPAAACINDVELPSHEREFRSQYNLASALPTDAKAPPSNGPLIGGGSALLSAAVVMTLTGRRSRK